MTSSISVSCRIFYFSLNWHCENLGWCFFILFLDESTKTRLIHAQMDEKVQKWMNIWRQSVFFKGPNFAWLHFLVKEISPSGLFLPVKKHTAPNGHIWTKFFQIWFWDQFNCRILFIIVYLVYPPIFIKFHWMDLEIHWVKVSVFVKITFIFLEQIDWIWASLSFRGLRPIPIQRYGASGRGISWSC